MTRALLLANWSRYFRERGYRGSISRFFRASAERYFEKDKRRKKGGGRGISLAM